MNRKFRVVIWGTGEGAKKALSLIDQDKAEIIAYADNDINKQNKQIDGIKVINPMEIHSYDVDYIVVGSIYYSDIYKQLISLNIEPGKIVRVFNYVNRSFKTLVKGAYDENSKYVNLIKQEYLDDYFNNYAICNMHSFNQNRNKNFHKYPSSLLEGIDYVRISSLDLIAKEIYEREIEGCVAELGVYKGEFAEAISDFFPDRRLLLFDTFEGFHEEDISIENRNNFSKVRVGQLNDTSVDVVLNRIKNKDRCTIYKGYFPLSAAECKNEKFAFVSIDVDLFKPTYEGLKFFYSRLSKGGYILVHDYNTKEFCGIKEAVRCFCGEKRINYFPLSDYCGSVVIMK